MVGVEFMGESRPVRPMVKLMADTSMASVRLKRRKKREKTGKLLGCSNLVF
jgi:hypothetical protein